jgi:hypothetical protein
MEYSEDDYIAACGLSERCQFNLFNQSMFIRPIDVLRGFLNLLDKYIFCVFYVTDNVFFPIDLKTFNAYRNRPL